MGLSIYVYTDVELVKENYDIDSDVLTRESCNG